MGEPRKARESRRGSALVFSLLAVILVAGLSASFLQLSAGMTRRQAQSIERKQAFYLAEAGLTESLVGIQLGKTGNVGTAAKPARFGHGLFWVEVTDLGDGVLQLESFAHAGASRVELSLAIEPGEEMVSSLGFFGAQELDVGPGTRIDAWDSSAGAYDSGGSTSTSTSGGTTSLGGTQELSRTESTQVSQEILAPVGSNAAVSLSGTTLSPTEIRGSVYSGPDDQVTIDGEVTVTGVSEPRLAAVTLPEVATPQIALAAGVTHSGSTPYVVPPGTNGFESLHVEAGAEVVVQGPGSLVLGSLELDDLASLTFDTTGGRIDVYVTGAVVLAPGSLVEQSSTDPTRLTIQVEGSAQTPVQLFSDSDFHGAFFAPQAEVQVASDFEVFGSIVGDRLSFLGPVQLHFDKMLADLAIASTLMRLLSWRIVDMESNLARTGTDPFVVLGLDPALSEDPARSHEDQFISVTYRDLSLTQRTYSGMESAFDWSQVSSVDSLSRDGTLVETDLGKLTHRIANYL